MRADHAIVSPNPGLLAREHGAVSAALENTKTGASSARGLPSVGLAKEGRAAFTLIELILVMTILTIAISIAAPSLANFFRGRALESEARRLLALSRQGQSRAVSEGIPMDLWLDVAQGACGLEAEPSYETTDPRAVQLTFDPGITVQVASGVAVAGPALETPNAAGTSTAGVMSSHPSLPTIRFLPDGSISETSPATVTLTGRDGIPLTLGLSRNRLNYEIQRRNQ